MCLFSPILIWQHEYDSIERLVVITVNYYPALQGIKTPRDVSFRDLTSPSGSNSQQKNFFSLSGVTLEMPVTYTGAGALNMIHWRCRLRVHSLDGHFVHETCQFHHIFHFPPFFLLGPLRYPIWNLSAAGKHVPSCVSVQRIQSTQGNREWNSFCTEGVKGPSWRFRLAPVKQTGLALQNIPAVMREWAEMGFFFMSINASANFHSIRQYGSWNRTLWEPWVSHARLSEL